jgi:hypothetical protein
MATPEIIYFSTKKNKIFFLLFLRSGATVTMVTEIGKIEW